MTVLATCLVVFITASLFATSAIASVDRTIIHESADILYYDDRAPYVHDILKNNTDKTIIETEYCVLAYNEDGAVWNNPDYENWFSAYEGKDIGVKELQIYYPYEYDME